ncbi:cystathionine beta-lyase [Henriciella aquimarina]|uniref:cystathionine beta-lyase n=1 Tax=Henriciella aquimarina TaxID=545261 RepID=UPI0009FC35B6|nr:cystathionine beta-lyase [Henriciella aquimarina]
MKRSTRLIHNHAGTGPRRTVNPPVERASTVLLADRKALYSQKPGYGRMGLSVHRELEAAMCDLEQATHTYLTPSGLSACAVAAASVVNAGDTLLISDSIYGPSRRFCEKRLKRMGVTCKRFHPRDLKQIETLMDEGAQAVFLEAPGSLTFEVSDTPAIVKLAKARGIKTIMDNTWSAGVFHQPLALGVDISVQALTKYVVGHADAFGGAVMTADRETAREIDDLTEDWGISIGPEEAYSALRGTRTLPTRLAQHEKNAVRIANWLETLEAVDSVIHPALPSHPDHELWKRDFSGSSGLFSFILKGDCDAEIDAFISGLEIFRLGFSWGGFESLLIPCDEQLTRLAKDWTEYRNGRLIRIHVGLEDPEDLVEDLERAFSALADEKNT